MCTKVYLCCTIRASIAGSPIDNMLTWQRE
jgi:hypothetical protein